MTFRTFVAPAVLAVMFLTAPGAKADYLYSDPFSYDTFDRPTYNQGGYTQLNQNDLNHSSIWDSTIQDSNGNLYDCNNIGSWHSHW